MEVEEIAGNHIKEKSTAEERNGENREANEDISDAGDKGSVKENAMPNGSDSLDDSCQEENLPKENGPDSHSGLVNTESDSDEHAQGSGANSDCVSSEKRSVNASEHTTDSNNSDEMDCEDFIGFEESATNGETDIYKRLIDELTESAFSEQSEEESIPASEIEDAALSPSGSGIDVADVQKSSEQSDMGSSANSSPSQSSSTMKRGKSTSQAAATRNLKKISVDLSNPLFKKPFEYGWKRELVFRSTLDSSMKRNADIYYYTPSGKKVRSNREVMENLDNNDLTLDNFTFFKEAIGIDDPSKEIIREAKRVTLPVKDSSATPPPKKIQKQKEVKSEKTEPSSPTTPPEIKSPTPSLKATPVPKISRAFPRIKVAPVKIPRTNSTSSPKSVGKSKRDNLEMGVLPPKRKDSAPGSAQVSLPSKRPKIDTVSSSQSNSVNSTQHVTKAKTVVSSVSPAVKPCHIKCPGMMGVIPSLQCRLCLCLYHPECVGLGPLADSITSYLCKNCLQVKKVTKTSPVGASPPPLTPISALGAKTSSSTTSAASKTATASAPHTNSLSPPKLHRLPKPGDPPPKMLTTPHFIKINESLSPNSTMTAVTSSSAGAVTTATAAVTSLVGGVTTWLPPSSMVQFNTPVTQPNSGVVQTVACVGGKRFVVVPKQNVLSVSPAVGATAPDSQSQGQAFLVGNQNTSGLLLLPIIPHDAKAGQQAQYLLLNGPGGGNLILAAQPLKNGVSTAVESKDTTSSGQKRPAVDSESSSPKRFSADSYSMFSRANDTYNVLLHVCSYLKVQELLRVARVSRMCNRLVHEKSLWSTVRMKNSPVVDWSGCVRTLNSNQTKHLDLRKMLVPTEHSDEWWDSFCRVIGNVSTLQEIELCKCPASVVERVSTNCKNIKVINALAIRTEKIDLSHLSELENLQELRLKSFHGPSGLSLSGTLEPLQRLTNLKHLVLTTLKSLKEASSDTLGKLISLESLELGECCELPQEFGSETLPKLVNLRRLRFEKGQGKDCPTFALLEGASQIEKLTTMELVNFDIKLGFDAAISKCKNLHRLLIIPTYITQSATTNHMVMKGVSALHDNLEVFVWGITHELLRVTELFVDQCEDQKAGKKRSPVKRTVPSESIPILRPVPGEQGVPMEIPSDPSKATAQVDILPLSKLQKLLHVHLPSSKVKILKVPFHATWRQTIETALLQV